MSSDEAGWEPVAPAAQFMYEGQLCRVTVPVGGLTILDHFAAAALGPLVELNLLSASDIADEAYKIAAAMVREREHLDGKRRKRKA